MINYDANYLAEKNSIFKQAVEAVEANNIKKQKVILADKDLTVDEKKEQVFVCAIANEQLTSITKQIDSHIRALEKASK